MLINAKLKTQIKTLLIKLIRGKRTSIVNMKEKAYEYAAERLPKWFVMLFSNYIRHKVDKLFMEALNCVKCNQTTNL